MFELTEHAVIRFKQRYKKYNKKDLFDLFIILKKEVRNASLTYVSSDHLTHYYELPNHADLYFVVNKINNVCTTIKPLSHSEKIRLEYPSKFNL